MKFINDCDSMLPIEISLPFFNKSSDLGFNKADLNIPKSTENLNENKVYDLAIVVDGLADE
ncbi:hypothetical protein [Lentibacillus sediminis]|uniref:hypothetical protein n=1 Tax=Lentibacillus sediminis TaxID=1940529 RepID=UPI000C1C51CD|nr:hypothetical protein [Lentibacillus sediminis]